VPYFADEDEAPSTPKADAFLIPRENPRSLILRPIEQWPPHTGPDVNVLSTEDGPTTDNQNGLPFFFSLMIFFDLIKFCVLHRSCSDFKFALSCLS
jgi:hypothetical protein